MYGGFRFVHTFSGEKGRIILKKQVKLLHKQINGDKIKKKYAAINSSDYLILIIELCTQVLLWLYLGAFKITSWKNISLSVAKPLIIYILSFVAPY